MRIHKLLPEKLLDIIDKSESPKIDLPSIMSIFQFIVWSESRKNISTDQIIASMERNYGPNSTATIKRVLYDHVANEVITTTSACLVSERVDYSISEDFYSEFKKLSLDQLKFSDLPEKFIGFVDFKNHNIEGCSKFFIWLGSLSDYPVDYKIHHELDNHTDTCINIGGIGEERFIASNFILPKTDISIKEFMDKESKADTPLSEAFLEICKIIIYIISGQPDIRDYQNSIRFRGSGQKPVNKDRDLHRGNIKLVGFGWKKPKIYGLDSWPVKGHFRPQRFGPNNSQLKIIYISDQVRKRQQATDTILPK